MLGRQASHAGDAGANFRSDPHALPESAPAVDYAMTRRFDLTAVVYHLCLAAPEHFHQRIE